MNKKRIYHIILLLVIVFLLYAPALTSAKPEYAVKESKNCPSCHTRDGPPQLNELGAYYGTHNHSLQGFVPSPKLTPTPVPTPEIEIGVHMNTWDVGLTALAAILVMLVLIFVIRL